MAASVPRTPRKSPAATWAYIACVVTLAAAATIGWAISFGFFLDQRTLLVGLALGALCAVERLVPVSIGMGRASFEFGGVPILCALVLGGPACALLVAAPSAVYRNPSRTAFQGAALVLQVLAGSLVFSLIGSGPMLAASGYTPDFAVGTLAAGLAFFGLDTLIGPILMRLKYGFSGREILAEFVVPALPSDALAIATTLATALAMVFYGLLAALILLCGAALSLCAAKLMTESRKRALRLRAENEALREALRDTNLNVASRLVGGLGRRDGYAAAHAAASAVYAGDIASEIYLDEGRSREVRLAALLMDVGLLWVPDEVLRVPPEKLNSLGRMHLEEHPAASEEILSGVPGLGEAARWVRWHHERPDGSGYPDGLRGTWIPLEARILAVASLYASLVLDGPSAPGIRPTEARRVLLGETGKALDEGVVRVFLTVLDAEDDAYGSASDERFSFAEVAGAQRASSQRPPTFSETISLREPDE